MNNCIKDRLSIGCISNCLYVGTDENNYDYYINYEEAGNIFIQGCSGSGKSYYFRSIIRRLNNYVHSNYFRIIVWDYLNYDSQDLYKGYLINNPHDFIKKIKACSSKHDRHTIVFINELAELLQSINENEKRTLYSLYKNIKKNRMSFICNSQQLSWFIDDYKDYMDTRICMKVDNPKQSIEMIGNDNAFHILDPGEMYVVNNCIDWLTQPLKVKVLN